MLGRSLCKFTYREEQESLLVDTLYKLNTLLTFGAVSLLMLRSIYSQGHDPSRVPLDILIPQVLQHASPETLSHALHRRGQSQDSLLPIDGRELEELGVYFLATISDSPHWSDDLSFADGSHQTIAHLCVLSGFTRLLTKVVNWGIDLDVQDVDGLTALHCAYLREDWDCVWILREAGANEYIKDNLGRAPREMCQHVESEGIEREAGRFSSAREEARLDVPRMFTSPGNFTLVDAQMMPQPDWRNSSDITASDGIRASPMPIFGPSSEDSFSSDDETWTKSFSNLQISESPPPLARPFSSITGSPGRRGDRPPRYGLSHLTYPPSPTGVQLNVSSGVPVRFHSLPATPFDGIARAFPIPEPAVPFSIPEPAIPFPVIELASQVHHFEPVAFSFPPPPSPPPATPSFSVIGQPTTSFPVHYLDPAEPVALSFPPPPSPPPATPLFSVFDQAAPSFPVYHVDLVEPVALSFPPPLSPPPATLSFSVIGQATPSFPVHHLDPVDPVALSFPPPSSPPPATTSFSVFDQVAPSFPVHRVDLAEQAALSFLPPLSPPPATPSFSVFGQAVPSFAVPGQAVPTFPVLERAVPTFPVLEPTRYLEENYDYDYTTSLSLSPSPQQSPPIMDFYPLSRYHTPAQTPHFHGPHATHLNSPLVSIRPLSSPSTQQLHQPPPSLRCDPPPTPPPPPHYCSSEGVTAGSPSIEKEETAAIRHQLLEAMRTTRTTRTAWPSASQEKERKLIESRIGQISVKGMGTLADAGDEPLQQPKQGED
jgi:hypothetical protein